MRRPETHPDHSSDQQAFDENAIDVPGLLLRVRRLADLSQRDAAVRLGISPARIAHLETGNRSPDVDLLGRILRLAGLRLAVLDADGAEVRPVSPEIVRDNAGRRFPAHLDVRPPDQKPPDYTLGHQHERPAPRAWYHQRAERDRVRARAAGSRPEEPVPDHPTQPELALRLRLMRGPQPRVSRPPTEWHCDCPDACYLGRCCLPDCPCQCEPDHGR